MTDRYDQPDTIKQSGKHQDPTRIYNEKKNCLNVRYDVMIKQTDKNVKKKYIQMK